MIGDYPARDVLTFRSRGTLSEEDFKRYLSLVRRIAEFDPASKKWIFVPEKALENVESPEEFDKIIGELEKLCFIEGSREILEEFKEKLRERMSVVVFNEEEFSFRLPRKISHEDFRELLKFCTYDRGVFRVKDIANVREVIEYLKKLGFTVKYDEEKLEQVLREYLECVIRREDGLLKIYFHRKPTREVLRRVREACTLYYNIEKAVFDEEGNFKEVVLVQRRIPVFEYSEENVCVTTSIGLIERVEEALKSAGYTIREEIEVLPDFQIKMSKNFELMPHQKEAFEKWMKKKRGTIAIFTRGGKSFIAMEAIYQLKKPTLILVTTRELASTWRRYLEKYLGMKPYYIGYVGEGVREIRPVTIAIYNSAVKYIDLLKTRFELAVFDESHHVPANTFKEVAIKLGALYRMALSATPTRRDGNHNLLYALCGDLVINVDYGQLLRLRIVAPIDTFKTLFVRGQKEKLRVLEEILRKHSDSKVIIFTQFLETAEKIYKYLLKKGFNVALITGSTPDDKRKMFFEAFIKGVVNILVTTTVLDEGITVPDAEVAVIYEGSGEARQMIQRIGRVLGYLPGKRAKIYEIIDMYNPREKRAYYKRRWVKELYIIPELKKLLSGEELDRYYQTKLV